METTGLQVDHQHQDCEGKTGFPPRVHYMQVLANVRNAGGCRATQRGYSRTLTQDLVCDPGPGKR